MSIVLSPESERQIEELVQSGRFASADEFVRKAAVHFREERAWVEELARRPDVQRQIEQGLRAIREGRYTTVHDSAGSQALADEIKREGRIAMGLPVDGP
jgi:Arc/MetJ-type ribon-helix-helix transcriptional regulator